MVNGDKPSCRTGAEQLETEGKNDQKNWSINKDLAPIKLYYFFTLSASGVLVPFIALYMKDLELSSSETGIILCTIWFVSFLLQPFVSGVADHLQKHKIVLGIFCVLAAIFHILLLLVPSRNSGSLEFSEFHMDINCNPYRTYIAKCRNESHHNTTQPSCPISFTKYINLISVSKNYSFSGNKSPFTKERLHDNDNSTYDLSCKFHCEHVKNEEIKPLLCLRNEMSKENCSLIDITEINTFVVHMTNVTDDDEIKTQVDTTNTSDLEVTGNTTNHFCKHLYITNILYQTVQYPQLICNKTTKFKCSFQCPKLEIDNCTNLEGNTGTFWMFFLIYFLGCFSTSPICVMGDALAYESLNFLGKERTSWGKQRFWGTLGFALFGVISTFVMDHLHVNNQNAHISYSISIYIFGGFCLLASVDIIFIKVPKDIKCSKLFANVFALLKNPEIICFLIVVAYFGILDGALESFLYWYLSDLGHEGLKIIAGLSLFISCIAEMSFMLISKTLIDNIGEIPCLYLSLAFYGIRFIGYSIIDNPWHTLPIELLHGPTFGLFMAAGTSFAYALAPKGMTATIQGLLSGIHFGLGRGIGSLITGYMYNSIIGDKWTFRLYGLICFILLLSVGVLNIIYMKTKKKERRRSHVFTIFQNSMAGAKRMSLKSGERGNSVVQRKQ